MQGVNVFENGTGYLFKCLSEYTSGTGFFVMYLIALAFILIKGTKRDRELFLLQAAVLFVTVYNPAVPLILDRIFDVNSEYYRLFWIAPVIILVPYVSTVLVTGVGPTGRRAAVLALVLSMYILGGNFVYAGGLKVAENIYKIDDELIEISDIIHKDSGTEYTRAFFEYDYNMEIRQYDPKMLLCIDREEYLYAMNYSYTDEMLSDPEKPQYRLLALLVRNQKISAQDLTDALEKTSTEYVVLTKGHPQSGFIEKAGLEKIGDTLTHNIYRYHPADPAVYELVDYSDTEHRFSYRRLK